MTRNQKHYCLEWGGYRISYHRSFGAAFAARKRRRARNVASMDADIVRLSDGRRWEHVGPKASCRSS
jgi:hypothetical protein